MNHKNKQILDIAIKHNLVRSERIANQYDPALPRDLSTVKNDGGDFYEVAVWNVKAALEAAFEAGKASK